MSLKGKRFVVTGAASGMGAATVAAYAAEGAQVVGLHRNRSPSGAVPVGVSFIRCDVSDKADIFDAMDDAAWRMGGLDGLIHAAAIAPTTAAEDISVEEMDEVLAINVRGTMLSNQAAFRHLREAGGRIVNFASSTGATGLSFKAHYAASKGAVLAWTRSIAAAWAPHAITANAVCPVINTDMYQATRREMPPEQLAAHDAALALNIPLGGAFGDPTQDFAPVIVFLGGDGARFLTGQTFAVDGGQMMVR